MKRHLARRVVGSLLAALALALVAGVAYERVSDARDVAAHPMPGRLVDIGSARLHLFCSGDGSPTVILEAGLGDSYATWRRVQPGVARATRVCSYDRAGLGYSDSIPGPRTSAVIADELQALVKAAGLHGPLVLVGHSMGGYDVRLYVHRHPADVAGVVLVDASHPEQRTRLPSALRELSAKGEREAHRAAFTAFFGLPRLSGECNADPLVHAAECNVHTIRANAAELDVFDESAEQAAKTGSFGERPLVVVSRDTELRLEWLTPELSAATNLAWNAMQDELPRLSTRGVRIMAKKSAHNIQLDRPDVVVDAIERVVAAVRKPPT